MPLPSYATLDELLDYYIKRMNQSNKNMERIKKFYNDDKSFEQLMDRIIEKDAKRFDKLLSNDKNLPNPWRVLYVVLDIVQNEGVEIKPFDTLTRMLPSISIIYHGWTFSWVHGEGTLISIFNNNNELIYRF
jgi:hypothetical protein